MLRAWNAIDTIKASVYNKDVVICDAAGIQRHGGVRGFSRLHPQWAANYQNTYLSEQISVACAAVFHSGRKRHDYTQISGLEILG